MTTPLFQFIQRAIVQGIPLLLRFHRRDHHRKIGQFESGYSRHHVYGRNFRGDWRLPSIRSAARNNINPFLAILIPTLSALLGSALLVSLALLLFDGYSSGKPECYGSGADDLRRGLRQLLWRIADQGCSKSDVPYIALTRISQGFQDSLFPLPKSWAGLEQIFFIL